MDKLNFRWRLRRGQYQSGERLYLNGILLGGFEWNATRLRSVPKDNSTDWMGYIGLPSLSDDSKRLYGSNPDEIKADMERVVTGWFEKALEGD